MKRSRRQHSIAIRINEAQMFKLKRLASQSATLVSDVIRALLDSAPEGQGPYVIQHKEGTAWVTCAKDTTLEAAEDYAWHLLMQNGGEWRVMLGKEVCSSGSWYTPGDAGKSKTATWSRR